MDNIKYYKYIDEYQGKELFVNAKIASNKSYPENEIPVMFYNDYKKYIETKDNKYLRLFSIYNKILQEISEEEALMFILVGELNG